MTKNKLKRYEAIKSLSNVYQVVPFKQVTEDFHLKGKWQQDVFCNDKPLVLELGCGKGEYSLALASYAPAYNYIGIDIKGDRIWKGAKMAFDMGLKNLIFIRTQIQFTHYFFCKNEVDEIWLTFPDPQLQKPRHRKRLSSPEFLNVYRKILKSNGIVHLKTDNTPLFEYTLDVIKQQNLKLLYKTNDVYALKDMPPILAIKTHYEKLFQAKGEKIKYLKFELS